MKTLHVKKKIALVLFIFLGATPLLQANSDPAVQCQTSKQEYVKVEAQWSALYTEASFLHDELNRLKNIAEDSKIVINVLHTAEELLAHNDKLSKAETATLNTRIPPNRGVLFSNGSFAITGHKAKPLKESLKILKNISKWSSEGVAQMQGNLAYIHPQISTLSKKVEKLETTMDQICTEEMATASVENEPLSTNDQTISNRFAQREQQRYEEVSNRQWGEIERAWVDRYYNSCRFRPCGVGIRH